MITSGSYSRIVGTLNNQSNTYGSSSSSSTGSISVCSGSSGNSGFGNWSAILNNNLSEIYIDWRWESGEKANTETGGSSIPILSSKDGL